MHSDHSVFQIFCVFLVFACFRAGIFASYSSNTIRRPLVSASTSANASYTATTNLSVNTSAETYSSVQNLSLEVKFPKTIRATAQRPGRSSTTSLQKFTYELIDRAKDSGGDSKEAPRKKRENRGRNTSRISIICVTTPRKQSIRIRGSTRWITSVTLVSPWMDHDWPQFVKNDAKEGDNPHLHFQLTLIQAKTPDDYRWVDISVLPSKCKLSDQWCNLAGVSFPVCALHFGLLCAFLRYFTSGTSVAQDRSFVDRLTDRIWDELTTFGNGCELLALVIAAAVTLPDK
uniref:Neur_chan_LBD domain-containing protein n=1 Tax=Steinernema glaseri TaxID=37863 RepID=A0A1I7ZIN5_9BILA